MVLQFFKAYVPHGGQQEVRDLKMIAKKYLESDLKLDVLALIPFQFLRLKNYRERLFYIIKFVRIKRSVSVINHQATTKFVKRIFSDHIVAKSKNDQEWGASQNSENYIGTVLVISYSIEILIWSAIILNTSYIMGMLWLIMCQFVEDFIH